MPTLTTSLNRDYALRFLGVAVLLAAFAAWFLYDGLVGYPAENDRVRPVAERLAQEDRTAAEWMNVEKTGVAPLVEAFRQAGVKPPAKLTDTFSSWISVGDPDKDSVEAARAVLLTPPHNADSIRTQFISAAISLLAALALALLVLLRWRTVFVLDDEALTITRFGQATRHPLAGLKAVDDSQWEKRGILRLTFADGAVTLDAWHHANVRALAARFLPKAPEAR
ncbi:MAG TPA: hypothetical protein IAC79_05645 [Candidatus Spyradenecus faecavium]|uniref:Uncharacterized protein n=1 Tax=Candidatus Spyradenecus faecavium TaxID=2840947 RepID=A0A9D1NP82_9BACT|nr:hypothetical protein [Candidatus Spyradenecus faecavium]